MNSIILLPKVMIDFTGLRVVDGLIIPHCNRKEDFINKLKNETKEKIYLLYDGDGINIKYDLSRH